MQLMLVQRASPYWPLSIVHFDPDSPLNLHNLACETLYSTSTLLKSSGKPHCWDRLASGCAGSLAPFDSRLVKLQVAAAGSAQADRQLPVVAECVCGRQQIAPSLVRMPSCRTAVFVWVVSGSGL